MQPKKNLILVLGMKRSGTSVLTKGLETMGVSLGDNLMPPNEFNETGYWEDWDFHELNFQMLKACAKNRARRIVPLSETEKDFLLNSEYFLRASELLLKKIPQDRPLALKVPTASLLIPFWKKICEVLEIHLSIVIAIRHPISVAISVERSFQDLQEKSFWIWISSLVISLQHTQGYSYVLVDYDELLQNPSRQMERIASALHLKIDPELLQRYTQHFIDPALRHVMIEKQHYSNSDLCLTLALQMYEKLLAVAQDQIFIEELQHLMEQWSEKLRSIQGLLVIIEMHEFTIARLVDLHMELMNSNSSS
jgi:hypothetical protein